jgi:hypothetical protein
MAAFISIDLSKLGGAAIYTTTGTIVTNMTDNASFPSPPCDLKEISNLRDDLKKYLIDKELLSKMDRKNRDAIIKVIADKCKRNGQYVIMLFPDEEDKQLSSGFPSVRTRIKMTGPPDVPTAVKARNGKLSGEAIVNCKRHRGTVSLNVKVLNTATKEEFVVNSTSSTGISIKGLTPGQFYDFSVQAVGSKGTSDYSSSAGLTAT